MNFVAAEALFEAQDAPAVVPPLAAFVDIFLRDCAGQWKPATRASHRRDLEKRVVPDLGHKRIDTLTRADVIVWLENNTGRQRDCREALSVLSSLLRHAETLGLRPEGSNPCAGLRRRNSQFKARYLSDQEFHRLGDAHKMPVAEARARAHALLANNDANHAPSKNTGPSFRNALIHDQHLRGRHGGVRGRQDKAEDLVI